jgi:uncharacterized protein HemY
MNTLITLLLIFILIVMLAIYGTMVEIKKILEGHRKASIYFENKRN